MDTNTKIKQTFRIQNYEKASLKNTLKYLKERKKSLTIDFPTQLNYQKLIDSLPESIQKRNSLLEELEEMAKEKYEESNHSDITSNLCLFLINKLRTAEEFHECLEKQCVEAKYGDRLLFAELAEDQAMPKSLEEMRPKYEVIKKDLANLRNDITSKKNALRSIKTELENARKSFKDAERQVPDTMRTMMFTIDELNRQYNNNEEKILKETKEYQEKKKKYEKRVKLIDEIVFSLTESINSKRSPGSSKVFNELKLILENINGNNRSEKFIKSRVKCLISALAEEPQIQRKTVLPPQMQLRTPQPIKTSKPPISPQIIRENLNRYKSMCAALKLPDKMNDISVGDINETYEALQKQLKSRPSFVKPPPVKSSE